MDPHCRYKKYKIHFETETILCSLFSQTTRGSPVSFTNISLKPANRVLLPQPHPLPWSWRLCVPKPVWESIWPQLLKGENKKSVRLHTLLPIMHRAQTCFAHIYYPINIFPMCSMVYCCVWSWFGTPYALWDGGQVQVAISMPSSPEVSAMEYLL